MQTQFALEIEGRLESYSKVFDLTAYKKAKTKWLPQLYLDKGALKMALKKHAREKRVSFPVSTYIQLPLVIVSKTPEYIRTAFKRKVKRIKWAIRKRRDNV